MPTGSAVVGDIIDIIKNNIFILLIAKRKIINPMEETICKYYIRIIVKDKPGY